MADIFHKRPRRVRRRAPGWSLLSALLVLLPRAGFAQQAPAEPPETVLPTINVIAPTPVGGSAVDRGKVPAETTILTNQDISRGGNPDALRALDETAPGVALDASSGNPFQPSLFYHGFQASPLQGTAQGLAVYVNGTRFNQPFGDTVNWDLIPSQAIDRLDVVGSNPVFGLNALGGALSVQMKNGFTWHGGEFDLLGGSFTRYQGELQYGVQSGDVAGYAAAGGLHDGGWRDQQSSDLLNFYGDLGWRGNGGEVHVNLLTAHTRLNGPGTTPIEALKADPAAAFTAPNLIVNKYARLNASANWEISDRTSLQGSVYYDYLQQKVDNGGVSDFAPCDDGSGLLCQMPGVFATDRNGNPIPDFLNGGPYSQLNRQSTNTNGYGANLQVTNRTSLFGRDNQLVAGVSFDGGQTLFSANSQIGGFDVAQSLFTGPSITVDQADGSVAPVRVGIGNAYYGAFFTDIYQITPAVSANLAGRLNYEQIDLQDQLGGALGGHHDFFRFNPSAGLTWKLDPDLSFYASYAEANRAPTPAELSCASPASPCSLANFFVGDPSLQQVVAHTIEAGVRGQLHPFEGGTLSAELALYRSTLDNDILPVNSPIQGRAFFENVGGTLRQGLDLDLRLKTDRLLVRLDYSYIDAEFQSAFTEQSQNNPASDANGNIQVRPGDRLPGIPEHLLKLGADWKATAAWTIGGGAIAASGRYLFGDEANLTPKTPPYFVLNLHTSYQLTPNLQLFGRIENAFNARYFTYGTFSPTASIPIAQAPGASNPRSYAPAAPIGVTIGLRGIF